jgi:broad specificity phosphatase PhoE
MEGVRLIVQGMRLILIRHGESEHSLSGIIAGGSGCTGLTERGVRQVRALGDRLSDTGELSDCAALLSSPWKRARQTAEILKNALSVKLIEEDPSLCELHPGEADGLSREDYRARYGAFDLQAFPDRPFALGGESWSKFIERVQTILLRLANRFNGQTVVAVTHAGFVVASFLMLFDATTPRSDVKVWLDPENTALTEWYVSGTIWRLVRYNDAYHLLTTT